MSDFNFCQNCQEVRGITEDLTCAGCGELICLVCGCTDSEPCAEVCEWARPGVCSNCADNSNLSGKKFYQSLDLAGKEPFENLSAKDQFVFNTIAEVTNEVLKEKNG